MCNPPVQCLLAAGSTGRAYWHPWRATQLILSLLAACLFSFNVLSSKAWAADYQVAYAIDARGLRESGKYGECVYGTTCRLNFERTSIRILIRVDGRQKRHFVVLSIYDRINCCYFSDGDNLIQIDGDKPYHQLSIFEGRKRLGNEFVLNRKIGDIFLAFKDFR
jgi:hypothetical protein